MAVLVILSSMLIHCAVSTVFNVVSNSVKVVTAAATWGSDMSDKIDAVCVGMKILWCSVQCLILCFICNEDDRLRFRTERFLACSGLRNFLVVDLYNHVQ
jgi:hypothetical protein